MNNRISMYRLLRKLEMVWFDRFLQDLEQERQTYDKAVERLIIEYDQNRYMETNNA